MNIYALITPIVLILLIAEIIYSIAKNKGYYSFQDTMANLATGIGNQCINLGVAFFVYKFYGFLYQFAPYKFEAVWYNYVLLLILQDFVFYWFHRTGHSINIFWAAHMPHHSSEELNLSVGIRASFTQRLFQFAFFDWVFPLLGFSPEMVYSVAAVHLLIAYWHHTKVINKLGWVEKIFVTPAHHRVHHGVNTQYLDKNFSEVFILWDRIFGTHEEEKEEVCYGVTKPPGTWDPLLINIQFWKHLWDDMIAAPYFIDKIKVWFMPLGWRPRGVGDGNIPRIGYTLEEQTKFKSTQTPFTTYYLIFQLVIGLLITTFTINKKLDFITSDRILLCIALFVMIVSWSKLLEGKKHAIVIEIINLLFLYSCLFFVLYHSFSISLFSWQNALVAIISGISISWICFIKLKIKAKNQQV
jgi:alkylglycerol monooxygenase